jgi:hypothetical protein
MLISMCTVQLNPCNPVGVCILCYLFIFVLLNPKVGPTYPKVKKSSPPNACWNNRLWLNNIHELWMQQKLKYLIINHAVLTFSWVALKFLQHFICHPLLCGHLAHTSTAQSVDSLTLALSWSWHGAENLSRKRRYELISCWNNLLCIEISKGVLKPKHEVLSAKESPTPEWIGIYGYLQKKVQLLKVYSLDDTYIL